MKTMQRDGFALPVALMAMMVVGAIVTGGFYASSQESRISTSSDLGSQAFFIAEYGLNETLGTLKNDVFDAVADRETWTPVTVESSGSQALGTYEITVQRIGARLFVVTSEGTVSAGSRQATRRVATLLRTVQADLPYPTALAVYGGITAGGSSEINGADAGGPGCAAGASVAGVTAQDVSLVDEGNHDRIKGDPDVSADAAMDTSKLTSFGAVNLSDLIAQATKVYDAGESENGMAPQTKLVGLNLVCDTSQRDNWGDPSGLGPCADEMPIIYGKGDLHLKTGSGQGVLIVNGDLLATGNFDFYGIVIVLGTLKTSGTGNHLEGSVIVMGEGELNSESITTGNSLVQYSQCRVERAFNAALRPRALSKRSWVDLSAAARADIAP